MRDTLIAYLSAALVMVALDFCWLSLTAESLYHHALGPLMSEKTYWPPAIAFYLLYLAGLVFFAVLPALESGGWREALLRGAALGLVAYGAYDLTNMATLKVWPLHITLVDMAWGAFITAVASGASAASTLTLGK
jgi:uncharacterized membrane protein